MWYLSLNEKYHRFKRCICECSLYINNKPYITSPAVDTAPLHSGNELMKSVLDWSAGSVHILILMQVYT